MKLNETIRAKNDIMRDITTELGSTKCDNIQQKAKTSKLNAEKRKLYSLVKKYNAFTYKTLKKDMRKWFRNKTKKSGGTANG